MPIETKEKIGDFEFRHIGGNHIAIYPHPSIYSNSCLTMTGSAVKKYIQIPYLHRIVKLVLIHYTSTVGTKSTDKLNVSLECEAGGSSILSKLTDFLFGEDSIIESEFIEPFGENFEYEPRSWALSLNSTSTDLVLPVLYIQKIGG